MKTIIQNFQIRRKTEKKKEIHQRRLYIYGKYNYLIYPGPTKGCINLEDIKVQLKHERGAKRLRYNINECLIQEKIVSNLKEEVD